MTPAWKSKAAPTPSMTPELDALTSTSSIEPSNQATTFDIARLAELLFFSAGLTREVRYPFGSYYMRAAPATGALYPIEVYVICMDERVIGHSVGGKLGETYDRYEYRAEKLGALEAWAAHVDTVVSGAAADNVVSLREVR